MPRRLWTFVYATLVTLLLPAFAQALPQTDPEGRAVTPPPGTSMYAATGWMWTVILAVALVGALVGWRLSHHHHIRDRRV